ncbi:MAG: methyl-accepting chemotaxis protein [Verrucomicrobiae bacterium]|nr:methyl-accepting chemotaxis protein [Verrucomicrobiae bacterium]
MKNWTIGKRIITGFSIIVALSAIMGILAWKSMCVISTHGDELANAKIPGMTATTDIMQNLSRAHLILIRHVLTTNLDEKHGYEAMLKEIAATNATIITDLEKVCTGPEQKHYFESLKQARADYINARAPVLALSNAGKNEEALAELLSSGRVTFNAYDALSTKFSDFETKDATEAADTIQLNAKHSKVVLASVIIAQLILSCILSLVVVVGLNRVLRNVSQALGQGAEQVTSAAGQVSSASQTLAEGASEQAASLEETSSSLEEMASMTKNNAENTQKTNTLAKQTRAAADKGSTDMQAMIAAMNAIKVSSDDIAKIIKTIDEIAFQTNILALNAAVEAARAGEAGMGFAVVADEVRNLAQRSAQAAKETATKIEGAIAKSAQGVGISNAVAQSLNEIVTKARQVDELAAEVANASREQTEGITQINTAVGQMDKVTQSNAASAEESAAAAEELNAQAETMKQSVAELLQLVGGQNGTATTRPAGAAQAKAFQAAVSKAKRHLSTNGKGHTYAAPAPAGNRQSEIPMEAEFKDF